MSAVSNSQKLFNSATGKVLSIGFLVLLLLIPLAMVEGVISERVKTYRIAKTEVTGSWGREVSLSEPVLALAKSGKTPNMNTGYYYNTHYIHLLPDKLNINGRIETQLRKKGIYEVPVYTGKLHLRGHFNITKDMDQALDYDEIASMQMILDANSLNKPPVFKWNGKSVPIITDKVDDKSGQLVFYAKLKEASDVIAGNNSFEIILDLSGSNALSFQTGSRETEITLDSNWASPGFYGGILPLSHSITDAGFEASWKHSNFFSDIGRKYHERIEPAWFKQFPSYGVKFIQTVDTYQQVTRVIKYAVLFLTLVFAVYFLFETLGNKPLHPIQYMFIGFANCVFYLLLLSLAEHINFTVAYFISAIASSILIALYSISILQSRTHGVLIFIKLSILYSFLLIILKSEDFALLIGSIGLFTILASIMYFTRDFNWRMPRETNG